MHEMKKKHATEELFVELMLVLYFLGYTSSCDLVNGETIYLSNRYIVWLPSIRNRGEMNKQKNECIAGSV
jgi:hypothetical protein